MNEKVFWLLSSMNKIFGCLDPSSLSTYIENFLGAPQDDERARQIKTENIVLNFVHRTEQIGN